MLRVNLLTVMAVILIVIVSSVGFSPVQAAGEEFHWKNVGAESNKLDKYMSLELFGCQDLYDAVSDFENRTTCIERGMRFDAMNFGDGKVRNHVLADFDGRYPADFWEIPVVPELTVYRIRECGNWATRIDWIPFKDSAIPGLIDEAVQKAINSHVANAEHGHSHKLLWLVALSAFILAIIALLRRGRQGPQGELGPKGDYGPQGPPGKDGVCTCGQSGGAQGAAEGMDIRAGLLGAYSKLKEYVGEKKKLFAEFLLQPVSEERQNLLDEINRLDEIIADLQKLIEATKPAEAPASGGEKGSGPTSA